MKAMISRLGLRRKLLLSYLVVFMIATGTMAWYMLASSARTVYENNARTVAGMAQRADDNLRRKLEQYEQSITMCVYNEELQRIYKNKYLSTYSLYRALTDTYIPFFRGLYATYDGDVSKLCMYSTRGLNKKSEYLNSAEAVRGEAWFQKAIGEQGICWHASDGVIYATCRVEDMDSIRRTVPLGVLYMEINTSALLDRYVFLSWPSYALRIRDAAGEILIERQAGEAMGGRERVFEAGSFSGGWTLEFAVPEETLRTVDRFWLPVESVVVAAGLAVLLILISVFTSTMLKGLNQLKDTMLRVNEGDLEVTVHSRSQDEIGLLAGTFNRMLETIRALLERTREDERRIAGQEARTLRAQIDPHFLYNTLSFINWKCIRAGQDDISDVIEQLATFYRTCLNQGQELITVATEIANITAYINIQLRLHDDSFTVCYDVPPELTDCRMPGFLLQPLVENAIRHGIDKRREGGGA
ncbi:MAG: histidine kinase, partial [Clostridia bacterium]|nr:histidine kinase [Clostridia bacterium]